MSEEPTKLSFDEAVAMLDVQDGQVHTFLNPNGMLVGADWSVEAAHEAIREFGAELGGEMCTRMKHGVVVRYPKRGFVFFATRTGTPAD